MQQKPAQVLISPELLIVMRFKNKINVSYQRSDTKINAVKYTSSMNLFKVNLLTRGNINKRNSIKTCLRIGEHTASRNEKNHVAPDEEFREVGISAYDSLQIILEYVHCHYVSMYLTFLFSIYLFGVIRTKQSILKGWQTCQDTFGKP